MWIGTTARRLGPAVAAGLACGIALAGVAQAQEQQAKKQGVEEQDDLARLLAEVTRLLDAGKYGTAAPLAEQAVALARERHGEEHLAFASAVSKLASIYRAQGRYAEAAPLYESSLATTQKALGPEHDQVARLLNGLAISYESQRRSRQAETLYKRSIAITEKVLGHDHPDLSGPLNNLALLYERQGHDKEAERLLMRSLAILEKALGPEHRRMAGPLNNLALLYQRQGRHDKAGPLLKRGLVITEKALGPDHPDLSPPIHNLALVYRRQARYDEAEALLRRSLAILEKALGPEHPRVASPLGSLGLLFQSQGRFADAEPLYKHSLAIRQKALGPDHPDVGQALSNLAGLAFAQGRWAEAADYWQRSIRIIKQRTWAAFLGCRQEASGQEVERRGSGFLGLIKATHRVAAQDSAAAAEMFEMAQWVQAPETAAAIAQMAARSAKGSPQLSRLVRERQDLMRECNAKDKLLIAAKTRPPEKRDAAEEAALVNRLAAVAVRLAAIDRQLADEFPNYAALASPSPASVAEVQAQLGASEALLLVLDTPEQKPLPEESFIWVVTRSESRWVRIDARTKALAESVGALRCGLDNALWNDTEKSRRCVATLKAHRYDTGPFQNVLPFDLERAHTLYRALLGSFEDLIANKHLLIVASGPLASLPFNVLVTEPPKTALPNGPAGYRDATWLGTRQPVTVLPAVASLKALRQHAKVSGASKAYIGVGNPLLDGPADADHTKLARAAHAWQRCSTTPSRWQLVTSAFDAATAALRGTLRARHADIEYVRRQVPLPETAFELCETARELGVPESEVLLGGRATEAVVKDLSEKGRLADYRVVHFATHGVLAGEMKGESKLEAVEESQDMRGEAEPTLASAAEDVSEPGLLLTPPPKGTSDSTLLDHDDGFLTASEIATLKLDADWVVLSACNTAGTSGQSAEALSGLARAFFYAGARTLLVSHWGVDSYAAVTLTTRALQELDSDHTIGRAEAFRRSMRDLIRTGSPIDAHPMRWAAFAVVGEGAR